MRRTAFTLIELLITIGIIVILAAMIIFATRAMTGGSKAHATAIALENCKSLLAEYDTVKRLSTDSTRSWIWIDAGGAIVMRDPTTAAANTPPLNFWLLPAPPVNSPPEYSPLVAPGYVKNDSHGAEQRNLSPAVVNTMAAMSALGAIPANRQAMQKLPQDQIFLPEWSGTTNIPGPGSDHVMGTSDDTTIPVSFPAGCRVKDTGDGNSYICVINHQTSGSPPSSDTTHWRRDTAPTPMMRDGWGNPIILVPATGLMVLHLNDQKEYQPSDPRQKFVVISPEGSVVDNGTSTGPKVMRPGRPFFASAGPDGDFSKGDDNIYSFEQ